MVESIQDLQRSLRAANDRITPEESSEFLAETMGKQLRVHSTDNRVFVGQLQCTDNKCNLVLSYTHEYRKGAPGEDTSEIQGDVSLIHLPHRFVGTIVVPGNFIERIERERIVSLALRY